MNYIEYDFNLFALDVSKTFSLHNRRVKVNGVKEHRIIMFLFFFRCDIIAFRKSDIMTFEEIARTYVNEVRGSQIMGLKYLDDIDIDICKYVLKRIPADIDISNMYVGNSISLDELICRSLDEIKIFGDEFNLRIKDLLSKIIINRYEDDLFYFSTYVVYSLNDDDSIDLNSGRVDSYSIPCDLFELSLFDFVHEHIHSLKETNYYEYINSFVLGETISLFYELISFNLDNILRREIIMTRLYNLNNDKNVFITSNCFFDMANDIDDKLLFEHIRSKVGCYLNSFYYAVILYNMYKETPKKILDLVSRVLKHEITTLQMLEMLNLYGDIRGSVFEKELDGIKKVLK